MCAGVTLWCTFGSADPSSGPRREQQARRKVRDRKDKASFRRQKRGEKTVDQTRLDPNK